MKKKQSFFSNNMGISQPILDLEQDESVVYQKEIRIFTIESDVKKGQDLILPFSVSLKNKVPISSKCFFRLSKTSHNKGPKLNRQNTRWNPNQIKFDFEEDAILNFKKNQEPHEIETGTDTTNKLKRLPKKVKNPFGREYIKVINRISAVYISDHTVRKVDESLPVSEKLQLYQESNECLVDTKEFKVISNYNNLRQEHFQKDKVIFIENKLIKKCFRREEVPIYRKISIGLEKDYISNYDSCYNFVVKVDKQLLHKYPTLDLVIKVKLIRINNFENIFKLVSKSRLNNFARAVKEIIKTDSKNKTANGKNGENDNDDGGNKHWASMNSILQKTMSDFDQLEKEKFQCEVFDQIMEEHKASIKFLERIVYMQSYNLKSKLPRNFFNSEKSTEQNSNPSKLSRKKSQSSQSSKSSST